MDFCTTEDLSNKSRMDHSKTHQSRENNSRMLNIQKHARRPKELN